MKICKEQNCEKIVDAKNLCNMHYLRLWRYGRLNRMFTIRNGNYKYKYPGQTKESNHKKRFGGLREAVIQRDKEKCVWCKMTRKKHRKIFGKDLTVDHIDGNGRYSSRANNTMENLQTLCLRCHGSKDATKHGKYAHYKHKTMKNIVEKDSEKNEK